ncbi:MAG: hypothetical protein IAF38_18155 [Bacteroidia bacterium]|nr:hypothetical protein [Bacteroidia bacterium]
MQEKDYNYFEKEYLGKNNDKVSVSENKRLQKLLSVKAFNRAGDSVRADFKSYRPIKKEKSNQPDFGLLLEGFN